MMRSFPTEKVVFNAFVEKEATIFESFQIYVTNYCLNVLRLVLRVFFLILKYAIIIFNKLVVKPALHAFYTLLTFALVSFIAINHMTSTDMIRALRPSEP